MARAREYVITDAIGKASQILETIDVKWAKTERVLRAFGRAHADDAHWIEYTLKFREAVAIEFEKLPRDGLPDAALLEVEESESDVPWINRWQ